MTLEVVQAIEDALSQWDNLVVALQSVERIDLTLTSNDKGIHAVDAARRVQVADGLVEFCESFILLPQIRHYQTDVGLGAPAFGLLTLLLTELGLLGGPT